MSPSTEEPHVVVVGAGLAGCAAAWEVLRRSEAKVTVVSDRGTVELPYLYFGITAGLLPKTAAMAPLHEVLGKHPRLTVKRGRVDRVDHENRQVHVAGTDELLTYTHLVWATGVEPHMRGLTHALSLGSAQSAADIRDRIVTTVQAAQAGELGHEPVFVFVGGGPIGVELSAGVTQTLEHYGVHGRVALVEYFGHLLHPFPEQMQREAREQLEDQGVELILGTKVDAVGEDGLVTLSPSPEGRQDGDIEPIRADVVVVAAGVHAPSNELLGGTSQRIEVTPDMRHPELPGVFVVGDAAAYSDLAAMGGPAHQMGAYVGKVLAAELTGSEPPAPFKFRDKGVMAITGRTAVVRLNLPGRPVYLSGRPAWYMWWVSHLVVLPPRRQRMATTRKWAAALVMRRRWFGSGS